MTDDCGDSSDEKNCTNFTQCDFELKNICSWTNNGQWSVVAPYQTNGPSRDHTTGLSYGSYLFLRGGLGSKSTLVSPIFQPTNLCEFRIFIYIFANSNAGEFNVYSRTANNGGDRLLLSIETSQGKSWKKRIIAVAESIPFQIVVEGVKSSDSTQAIAIDDTSFNGGCVADNSGATLPTASPTTSMTTTSNSCNQGTFLCPTNKECIPSYKVCDFIKDCPDGADEKNCGTCDFETSSCGWYDDNYELTWVRKTGPSSNSNGPQIDHTLQSSLGSYLITQRNNGGVGSLTGVLISPTLGPISQTCSLSFWAHMGDINIPESTVDIILYLSNAQDIFGDFEFLAYIVGPTGRDWKQYKITLLKKPAGFLIDLYGFTDYSNLYDKFTEIAIDDVVFENCAENVFICGDGTVISDTKQCDFKNDCADGSDEKNCGTCDFETSTCGWKDGGYGTEWILKKGPSVNSFGPQFDHTLLSSAGSYMTTNMKFSGQTAGLLLSSSLGQLASTCTFTFWAHLGTTGIIPNPSPHQIDVYITNEIDIFGLSVYIGSAFGPTGSDWRQYRITLGAKPRGYLMSLWGFNTFNAQNNVLTEIGFDDVEFANCAELTPSPDETFDCGDGSLLSNTKVCDFIKDCSTGVDEMVCGNCDFDKSFCNWFDDSMAGSFWQRQQASAATTNTGPSIDHTLGTSAGSYAFVNSKEGNNVDYADLVIDKDLGPSSTTCEIEFYYHMKGKTDDLILYIASDYDNQKKFTYVFEFIGDAGDKWNRAVVTLGRIREKFRIQFSAERFFVEPNNDVAIDDVRLFNCEFPEGIFCFSYKRT